MMHSIYAVKIWVIQPDKPLIGASVKERLDIPHIKDSRLDQPIKLEYQYFDSLPQVREMAYEPDVIVVNFGQESLELGLITKVRELAPTSVVAVLCQDAHGTQVVAGLKAGANDFILAAMLDDTQADQQLTLPEHIVRCYQMVRRRSPGRRELSHLTPSHYVGQTMLRIRAMIPHIITSAIRAIYVEGETGTGKEVVADLFRDALPSDTPFIKVNCGAIAPTLMESEFFGHVKGSFTGAIGNKVGFIEKASGGFLFLDEVANLTPVAQAALLRVIESQEVIRIGETQARAVQVRYISATNESLEKLVKEGRFRQDLWQRLTEKTINLPPLRQRRDEIDDLITAIAHHMAGGPYKVTERARRVLREIPFSRGNIRELRNCLRAMTEFQFNQVLDLPAIPMDVVARASRLGVSLVGQRPATAQGYPQANGDDAVGEQSYRLTLEWRKDTQPTFDDLTDQLLIKLLERKVHENGKLSLRKLAMSMGMVRNTLSNRLKALAEKNMLKESELNEFFGR